MKNVLRGMGVILAVSIVVSAVSVLAMASKPWWSNDFLLPPGIYRSGVNGDERNYNENSAAGIGNAVSPFATTEKKRRIGRGMIKSCDNHPEHFSTPHNDGGGDSLRWTVTSMPCDTSAGARGVVLRGVLQIYNKVFGKARSEVMSELPFINPYGNRNR